MKIAFNKTIDTQRFNENLHLGIELIFLFDPIPLSARKELQTPNNSIEWNHLS